MRREEEEQKKRNSDFTYRTLGKFAQLSQHVQCREEELTRNKIHKEIIYR